MKKQSFEENMDRLEEIVSLLEQGDATLGESLTLFTEGSKLLAACRTRRVLAERPIIGSLMAAGARRGRVIRHYLLQGSIIGLLGALAGIALGIVATGAVTRAYTAALEIPDTIVELHPPLWGLGLLFGLAVGLLGAAAPAVTAQRSREAAGPFPIKESES